MYRFCDGLCGKGEYCKLVEIFSDEQWHFQQVRVEIDSRNRIEGGHGQISGDKLPRCDPLLTQLWDVRHQLCLKSSIEEKVAAITISI